MNRNTSRTMTEPHQTALQPNTPATPNSAKWSGRTRGGTLGNWIFLTLIRIFGIRSAYALLIPVALYYLLAAPRSVRSSHSYLRAVLGPQSAWRWPFLIYRHFFSLGMSLLDRYAMLMGRDRFSCTYEGEEHIANALAQGKGVVLVSAHVGNWAAGGHLLRRLDARVNLVVLQNEVKRVQRLFDRMQLTESFRILPATQDLSSSLSIMSALRQGEIVVFNGDRAVSGSVSAEVQFFDKPADFPTGPYLLAAMTGAPMIQTFAMRDGIDQYRFFCSPAQFLSAASRAERNEVVRECAARFANRLEFVLRDYPFQWYNFYPFWKVASDKSRTTSTTDNGRGAEESK
jgi:predicted LPLAT superfamily acyltransferase